MRGFENIDPLKCPCCLVDVTAELEEKEAADFAAITKNKQQEALRGHSSSHYGAMLFQELVLFHDAKWRGSSKLHRTTNMTHNNIIATFMDVAFDTAVRASANEILEDGGALFRFPVKSAKHRAPTLGNGDDARLFLTHPTMLVKLIALFFPAMTEDAGVAKLLEELSAAAAEGAKLFGPAKRSKPRKRAAKPAAAQQAKKPPKKRAPKKPRKGGPGVQAAAPAAAATPAAPATLMNYWSSNWHSNYARSSYCLVTYN